jgi:hypothetical protein
LRKGRLGAQPEICGASQSALVAIGRRLGFGLPSVFIFGLYGETKFRYQGYGAAGAMAENAISTGKTNGSRPKSFRIKAAGNPAFSARKILS